MRRDSRRGMQGGERSTRARRGGGAWAGFLVMAFVILGLCGLFATYAAQLPFERSSFAESRLDAAATAPDGAARLASLRKALGEDGAGAFVATGPLPERIAAARQVLRHHFDDQAADIALRLRIVIAVFTAGAALFGVMVVSVLRRSGSGA